MKPFLITGIPRSRTAWLANYFTLGDVVCYHEPPFKSVDGLINGLKPGNGSSDSSLCLHWRGVIANAHRFNLLIVVRNPKECRESLEVCGVSRELSGILVKECSDGLNKIISGVPSAMKVDYNHIDRDIAEIHKFLTPSVEFSYSRYDILNQMNITQDNKKAWERLEKQ